MKKSDIINRIVEVGVIPVVRAQSAEIAMRAIDAIKAGGVSVIEITMTVPGAKSSSAQARYWMPRLHAPAYWPERSSSSVPP
jgi:2-keto-3-deoxy-6-phosphogluconate aldolase